MKPFLVNGTGGLIGVFRGYIKNCSGFKFIVFELIDLVLRAHDVNAGDGQGFEVQTIAVENRQRDIGEDGD